MKLNFQKPDYYKLNGSEKTWLSFVLKEQMKNRELWKQFIEIYHTKEDGLDNGWRGEYWGKMLRGACLCYQITLDEELYDILLDAVEGLLATQDSEGRISSYEKEKEFFGWDMWCRKYVLVGLQHFYQIAKEDDLKAKVLTAMRRSLDYIISKIGKGKKSIFETSEFYGATNSCSILEPVMQLFEITRNEKYLEFAEYIIQGGGCALGSLLACVRQECMPYDYPEIKIYETVSFFEGVFKYGLFSGQTEYSELAIKFIEDVYRTDITITGGAGCRCELFNNSALRQFKEKDNLAQENCVTVTIMRMLDLLYQATGDVKYQHRLERSYYNVLLGAVNFNSERGFIPEEKKIVDALPFDSYSPIYYNKRGRAVSGYKEFKGNGFYSCCSAIGGAGLALFPLNAVVLSHKKICVNQYISGQYVFGDKSLTIETDYPQNGKIKLLAKGFDDGYVFELRLPLFCKGNVLINGKKVSSEEDYLTISVSNTVLDMEFILVPYEYTHNNLSHFEYGPLVLCQDEMKNGKDDLLSVKRIKRENGEVKYELLPPQNDEFCRMLLYTESGEKVLLTDYQSCGKKWREENSKISVFLLREENV